MGKLGYRRCFWHWRDYRKKVKAIASYYHIGEQRRIWVCAECLKWNGKYRDIRYKQGIEPIKSDEIKLFDKNCQHEMSEKNFYTEEDEYGNYDIIICKKCDGQRKRREFKRKKGFGYFAILFIVIEIIFLSIFILYINTHTELLKNEYQEGSITMKYKEHDNNHFEMDNETIIKTSERNYLKYDIGDRYTYKSKGNCIWGILCIVILINMLIIYTSAIVYFRKRGYFDGEGIGKIW